MLVIDASIAVAASLVGMLPAALERERLIGPPLLWSEAASALHELAFRGDVEPDTADAAIGRLRDLAITRRDRADLQAEAHRVARLLGWAKTYDAEYVALARLEGARLLTRDARLQRGAAHLVTILGPSDLGATRP